MSAPADPTITTFRGGCHCGAVRFEVDTAVPIVAQDCNCSLCTMSGFLHLIVPASRFRLLAGADRLRTYRFNTGVARHLFCEHCGVKSFYVPRSNPDGYSVNLRCLESYPEFPFSVTPFDGRNWEAAGDALRNLSIEEKPMTTNAINALVFDVFGTVVDWRGSIIREGKALAKEKNIKVQWSRLADGWRAGYKPAMDRVRSGELPWMKIDQLHRMILDGLLTKYKVTGLDEAEKDHLNRVWHRLKPWPDSVKGLKRLKKCYPIATLSNGNVSLLMHMARNAGLPWDCIISAELFRHYKPDAEAYLGAARLLDLRPEQVLMVAAHKDDLRAAQQSGLRTAFVARPKEKGARAAADLAPEHSFDFNATSFLDLADQLGA